ncbi:hypothetical protein ACOT81_19140 [Streptomyces sp. WI04-05B]|uniref:hypothetical protein n=1 Tax=Streptomyces TaxID=1883 RepID=UPI0029A22BB7|nr:MULTISPECIES: hypothetical protein [unclassified Streptomyces]MDX2542501.1 hypothetical protein [Streptomyces sp. WI04-05B]MDX2582480.1 hypothetical protein [Streptomyces sp. WI04-05A]MDX3747894.1 hypothetical protein [Streptomyces sp. AK08-02]
MTTMKGVAQLALVAQQFGYEYADLRQNGGQRLELLIVPDPRPQAGELAALNRARYPDAADGVSLPPVEPEAVDLLKARMVVDLGSQFTDKQRVAIAMVLLTATAAAACFRFRAYTNGIVIVGIVWAALMALLPVLLAYNRRYTARYTAQLRAAGFTPVTDPNGRLRYVPPDGRLPGHGNPFTGRP